MIELVLNVVLVLTSLLLIVLILLHRGKGGGLSSMFGGAVSSSLAGSSVVEKNLNRLTVFCAAGLGRLHRRSGHPAQGQLTPAPRPRRLRTRPDLRENVTGDRRLSGPRLRRAAAGLPHDPDG